MRKRVIIAILCTLFLMCVPVHAAEAIDLSGMSFAELQELQAKVMQQLWTNEEWIEVEVPVGVYEVGDEIPAGKWMVSRSDNKYAYFRVANEYSNGEVHSYTQTTNLETPAKVILENGQYIEVSNHPVVFTTYTPSFSFSGNSSTDQSDDASTGAENEPKAEIEVDESDEQENAMEEADGNVAEPTMGQKNALRKAQQYLEIMAFSYTGLIEQLEYEGYSTEDATYGVENCGADWNEQAKSKAEQYIDIMAFSRDELVQQLEYEGFTHEQAEYGVSAIGY